MTARISTVHLWVAELETMQGFYEGIIGLRTLDRDEESATLGVEDGEPLLALTQSPERKRYHGTTGLYHFAILLPTRRDLALSFRHLLQHNVRLQGASDHIVSEALYLPDPEGNGIEIYRDRPREEWFRNGEMQLATLPMDAEGVLREANESDTWEGLPTGTRMGHIHLHVADVQQAAAFYQSILGMDLMFNLGSAAFLSYDGYHHHIGINTWGVRGLAPGDALGLATFDLHVTPQRFQGIASEQGAGTSAEQLSLHDPAQNRIQLMP